MATEARQVVVPDTAEGASLPPADDPQLATDDQLLADIVLRLQELARRHEPAGSLDEQTLTTALAADLLQRNARSRPIENGPAHPSGALRNGGLSARQLARIVAYVDGHLAERITLRSLAGEVGLSVFHLARAFKARAGVAPHRYILQRRIDRAKELLGNTGEPVGEVAMRCGFAHPSHFASTFRRIVGTTPSRYRRDAAGSSRG